MKVVGVYSYFCNIYFLVEANNYGDIILIFYVRLNCFFVGN
jgi:hypothetical protein